MMTNQLPRSMNAVVAYGAHDYRLERVPVPEAGVGEIILKIEACGICAGDVKTWQGAPRFWGGEGQPKYVKEPVIPGHEFVGRVADLGSDIQGFKVGDRIIAEQIVPCGRCRFCLHGQYWMCQRHDVFGFQFNVNGGMAEYMRIPRESMPYVHRVPESLPLETAVLIEPFSCSMHTVIRANVQIGDVVVLSGAGPLGLGMIGPLRQRGPSALVVLDLKDNRLERAKAFGATHTLNPLHVDVDTVIKDMTEGYGADIYIEATGSPPSVTQGLNVLRKLGRFVEMSVFGQATTVDWSIISDTKELDVVGVHLSPYCYPLVISGFERRTIPTEGVVTHTFSLTDFLEGFETMATAKDNAIKVILVP